MVVISRVASTGSFQELPKEIWVMESLIGLPEFDLQHVRAVGTISHYTGNKQCGGIQDQTGLI